MCVFFYYGLVETVGELQLTVDAGLPVNSDLIRYYLNEVLADIITLTLGQREGHREPPAPASIQDTHTEQVDEKLNKTKCANTHSFYSYNNLLDFPSVLFDPVLIMMIQ